MDKNELKINISKTEFMVFGSQYQLQANTFNSLKADDTVITAKTFIKFLGTNLDKSQDKNSHYHQEKECTL